MQPIPLHDLTKSIPADDPLWTPGELTALRHRLVALYPRVPEYNILCRDVGHPEVCYGGGASGTGEGLNMHRPFSELLTTLQYSRQIGLLLAVVKMDHGVTFTR